jgi:hypothetical protein
MKRETTERPRLTIAPDPVTEYLAKLQAMDKINRAEFRKLIRSIVEEGKRFSQTEAGKIIKGQLANSEFIRNGWFFWNMSGFDYLLNENEENEPTPSEMWQQIWNTFASTNIERFLSGLIRDVEYYEKINITDTE